MIRHIEGTSSYSSLDFYSLLKGVKFWPWAKITLSMELLKHQNVTQEISSSSGYSVINRRNCLLIICHVAEWKMPSHRKTDSSLNNISEQMSSTGFKHHNEATFFLHSSEYILWIQSQWTWCWFTSLNSVIKWICAKLKKSSSLQQTSTHSS